MKARAAQRRVGVVEALQLQLAHERHLVDATASAVAPVRGPASVPLPPGSPPRVPCYFFLPLTACFNVAPALNFGAFEALIFTRSPVRGLTP